MKIIKKDSSIFRVILERGDNAMIRMGEKIKDNDGIPYEFSLFINGIEVPRESGFTIQISYWGFYSNNRLIGSM